MPQSKDLAKSIGDYYATEAQEKKAAANVERPAILDSPRPADPVSAERWERERELAEGGYTSALLRKEPGSLSVSEKTHLGRVLVQALKELQ